VKGAAIVHKAGNLNGGGNPNAYVRTMDRVTFNTTEVPPGTMVTVQGVVKIDSLITGGQSCSPTGQIGWFAGCTLTLYYGPTGANYIAHESYGFIDNDPESPDFTFPNGEVVVNLELPNGVENQLILDVFAYATVSAIGECTGNAKGIGSSFTWMGVIGATDSKGNPITQYTLTDEFGNDWTTPPSVADITFDGEVNVNDLLAVITGWGPCAEPCPPSCPADIAPPGGDCSVDVNDLLMVISNWED
ncbi:MAG TPA: hypothetical protein VMS30_03095, partial [Phycisphaerales bacterium]|nr:hypothetical protein [Phycisphaerales bacterium]